LDEGRAKFPKNNNLIIEDFLFYSEQGDNASAEKVINDAIAKNPKDVVLFYLQGIALSGMGRNDDAVAAYNKAIEINPKYFDAYYNIGNLYYNQGVAKIEKINEIKDNALYTKEKAAAEEFFKQAIPYLEKAREINPKDRDTRIMLKNIYFRLNMTDKYTEVNNSLKNG
jgi:tetratricopeptide (TPR) repeat protein